MGVAAGHLDWTMVPYVRKSFYKHYKDGMKYIVNDEIKEEDLDKIHVKTSIEDRNFYKNDKAWEYANDMTVKEVYQAVEGMFHNLNIWVA